MAYAWINTIFNFLAGGQYNSSPQTIGNGQTGPLQTDQYSRLLTVPAPAIAGVSTGTTLGASILAPSQAVKTSPGSLYQLNGSNPSANGRWIYVFDLVAVPANGTSPTVVPQYVAPNASFFYDYRLNPRVFATGIVWAISTSGTSFTLDTTQFWVEAERI
jgi:hypothetical protein